MGEDSMTTQRRRFTRSTGVTLEMAVLDYLRDLAEKAFSVSHQILIDQDLRGWKEVRCLHLVVTTSARACL